MMRLQKIVPAVMCALLLWQCGRLGTQDRGVLLARVGDKELFFNEVSSLFTPELSGQDSVRLLESFVDIWVKRQLKVQEAEKLFENDGNIKTLVEEYRNSLLTNRLDQYYVDNRLDTMFSDDQVRAYYDNHRTDFVLDREIVKGRILKVPESYRRHPELKAMITGGADRLRDLEETSSKNGFELTVFDAWTDYSDFTGWLPATGVIPASWPSGGGVFETTLDGSVYYAYITDSRLAGDISPLDRVRDVIRRIIFNQRKNDIIRHHEDSLYRQALESGLIEIKIN